MKNKFWILKSVLMIFVAVSLLNGCSSDDSTKEQEIITNTDVFRGQFVKITTSTEISEDTYQAIFDGFPISAIKTDSNEITFLVPVETQQGVKNLKIENLDISVNYNVQIPVLESTADQTLTPYFSALDQYVSQLESDDSENELIISSVSVLHQYYESLSQEEKVEFAIAYQINKEFFDELINPSLPVSPPGINLASIAKLSNFKLSVIGLVGSVFIIEYAPGYYKLLGIPGIVISINYVKEFKNIFLNHHVNVHGISLKEILDEFERPVPPNIQEEVLVFDNDEQEMIPIKMNVRGIKESDRQTAYGKTTDFFSSHDNYVQGISIVNSIISFVNNLPFTNIPLVAVPAVQANSSSSQVNIDNEDYSNFTFSVASSNVQVVNLQYSQGGLSLKLKVINPDIVNGNELTTTLNYTYGDDFNMKQGDVPIKILLEEEEEFNYQLQIGDYNPNYDLISPQMTLNKGANVTFPNYMVQMVRLLLDGQPVLVGEYSLPWTQVSFGSIPVSNSSINLPDHTIYVYDRTNNRNVAFDLNVTLTNEAYGYIVGRTLNIDGTRNVTFNADGTCTSYFSDGTPSDFPSEYSWTGSVISPSYQQCNSSVITTKVVGVVYLPEGNGVNIPSYILIEEGGTFRANSYSGCPDFDWQYISIE